VAGQDHLDLGRGDQPVVALEDVLDAVDDEEPAGVVEVADVTAGQPAVGVDSGRVLGVEVADHQLRTTDLDLATLTRREHHAGAQIDDPAVGTRHGEPDRAGRR
jgi:hypothetical protein